VASGGCGLPRGVRSSLGVTDGLLGLRMALVAAGGLAGSWVAKRGCRCHIVEFC
jgi:hypothetical protein